MWLSHSDLRHINLLLLQKGINTRQFKSDYKKSKRSFSGLLTKAFKPHSHMVIKILTHF